MGTFSTFQKKILPELALAFLLNTLKNLLNRSTIRSAIAGQIRKALTGSREKPYRPVPEVERQADKIMEIFLKDSKTFPDTICIDGPPGSGKSTLGRALAERCGLEWRTIFWHEIKKPFPFKSGRVYENIRLIRTQDIEIFDCVIYMDCPGEEAQARVISRDRNGALADVVNFSILKTVGDAAFDMLDGNTISMEGSRIKLKRKPENGYRDLDELKIRLWNRGIDTEGLSKEELLFIYCYGDSRNGIKPYLKLGAYNEEIFSGLYDAIVTSLGKGFLT